MSVVVMMVMMMINRKSETVK